VLSLYIILDLHVSVDNTEQFSVDMETLQTVPCAL